MSPPLAFIRKTTFKVYSAFQKVQLGNLRRPEAQIARQLDITVAGNRPTSARPGEAHRAFPVAQRQIEFLIGNQRRDVELQRQLGDTEVPADRITRSMRALPGLLRLNADVIGPQAPVACLAGRRTHRCCRGRYRRHGAAAGSTSTPCHRRAADRTSFSRFPLASACSSRLARPSLPVHAAPALLHHETLRVGLHLPLRQFGPVVRACI